jgi:3-hydroxyacyl-CoA dehydrogenase
MYDINTAAVIGAGTMGLGIAGQLANAGVDVLLLDIPAEGENRNAIGERAIERLLDDQQPGLTHKDNLARITIGNVEDDLNRLRDIDWIAEAIVERLDLKKALYRKIDEVRKPGSIVSSNTSTIPISLLVEDMPESFRAEFAITHFFNPVRYMRLLELVRGDDTRPEVIACLEKFNEERMGKGIVVCNDTPGFLGNRVGVFAIQMALHTAIRMGLTPEQADAIFGRPMGIPKTGVFGLYDLIGIDLMSDVASSLDSILPAGDAFHDVATEIPLMNRMIEEGRIGNKGAKGGFYHLSGPADAAGRQTLDFERFEYREFVAATDVPVTLNELLASDDDYGKYAWRVLSNTLSYAAALVPDVNESIVAIDDAMKLGYNWIQGPFEMIDAIGADDFVTRLESEDRAVPGILRAAAGKSLYRVHGGQLEYLLADDRYAPLERPAGVIRFSEERRKYKPEFESDTASYFILPQQIGLVEFHSKANTLDGSSMEVLAGAVIHSSENCKGLIVHNDAQHFSCGVNLEGVLYMVRNEDWSGLDRFLDHFQQTTLSMKHAPVPVIVAPSGLSLGGGFEVVLHADKVVCHANSVMGLVETMVGVVPGGGGVKEMLYRFTELHGGDSTKAAWDAFMTIGYGKTSRSPLEAEPLAMFRPGIDTYVMNRDRLLGTAIDAVNELSGGYRSTKRGPLPMPGRAVFQEMQEWLDKAHDKGHLSPHDVTTGSQVAMIVTGGDIEPGTELGEDDICDLERKAFLKLAGTEETRARIEHMLTTGRPLRN